jgi:hypothetical protein
VGVARCPRCAAAVLVPSLRRRVRVCPASGAGSAAGCGQRRHSREQARKPRRSRIGAGAGSRWAARTTGDIRIYVHIHNYDIYIYEYDYFDDCSFNSDIYNYYTSGICPRNAILSVYSKQPVSRHVRKA